MSIDKFDLKFESAALSETWKSKILGRAGGANFKVVRMDEQPFPNETHDFIEALLVIDGQMNLEIDGNITSVRAGEIYLVPAYTPHGVAAGSHGTLVIIDQ